MTKPLSTLLSESWAFVQSHLTTIAVGAVIFGLIFGAVQSQVQMKANKAVGNFMGMDVQKFQDLSQRMAQGDEEAAAELQRMGEERMANLGGTAEEREAAMMSMGMSAIGAVLPTVGIASLILLVVHLLSMSYFSVIAIRGVRDVSAVFSQSIPLLLPLLGLWIWIVLRTFIWIPIIGFIFAIILGPRFIAAPVLLVRDSKGIMDAASQSYTRTANYWGKIFGNMFVVGLSMAIISGVLHKVVGYGMGLWLFAIIQQLFMAYCMVFAVKLSETILEQPKAA